jgi:hypothetical protein
MRDMGNRGAQERRMLGHQCRSLDFGMRRHRADPQPITDLLDTAQRVNSGDVNQELGLRQAHVEGG